MNAIPIRELNTFGDNVSQIGVEKVSDVPNCPMSYAIRFGYEYSNGTKLESLLCKKDSNTLIVSLHGALDRRKTILPRFERLASLLSFDTSILLVGDPALYLNQTLELSWYTGWEGYNLYPDLAELIKNAALEVAAERIILSGSSGGGFASLQLAALIPNSIAVSFNPQTDVHRYWNNGDPEKHGAVRKYIEVCYPSAAPEGIWKIDWDIDWSFQFGDIHSPVRRFRQKQDCSIVYLNNVNDFHVEQHFSPFYEAVSSAGVKHLEIINYKGNQGHFPPDPETFKLGINKALSL